MKTRHEKEMQEAFLRRLRLAMSRADITQAQLARRLGLSKSSVSDWFNHGSMPSGEAILALPDVLDVSAAYLVTGDGEPVRDAGGPVGHARAATAAMALTEALEVLTALRDSWRDRQGLGDTHPAHVATPALAGRPVGGATTRDVELSWREVDRVRPRSRSRRRRSQGA